MRYLTVDGVLSGTGVRDAVAGGYIEPGELGLSPQLRAKIKAWLARYEDAHYRQFQDAKEVANLDAKGIEICREMRGEIPDSKIDYFSSARMTVLFA